MHGRIKTISTEEQKLKQKKSRDAKVHVYTTVMSRIVEKRSKNEYDDEALAITREVLLGNPDIITLWNYRREILLSKKQFEQEINDDLIKNELSLTELCLRVNPKSYGTWHHRVWVLDTMQHSNWAKEVELCNKYLALDERNFHCWDYRKIVVERASVPALEEYQYTTSKINSNFSNYSAWHFRSKLLPQLFEDPEGKYPVAEDTHKAELDLVQNAAFTDPDDQSAWFYQRWLLGLRSPAVAFVCAQITSSTVLVALSRQIRHGDLLVITVNGSALQGSWKPAAGITPSAVWTFDLSEVPKDYPAVVTLLTSENVDDAPSDHIEVHSNTPTIRPVIFSPPYSTALKTALEEQLTSCQQLLELEPDSKWTLLTSVLLMKSLDLSLHSDAIIESLHKLSQIDSKRVGYYLDLSSQIKVELRLIKSAFQNTFLMPNANLTCLYHPQYLVLARKVDLSGNKLKDIDLKQLASLLHCTQLILDTNLIQSLEYLPLLKNLEYLSVKNNEISDIGRDRLLLTGFSCLKQINF